MKEKREENREPVRKDAQQLSKGRCAVQLSLSLFLQSFYVVNVKSLQNVPRLLILFQFTLFGGNVKVLMPSHLS